MPIEKKKIAKDSKEGAAKKAPVSTRAKKPQVSKGGEASAIFAVIETGGKQYLVSPGKMITIEKLSGDPKEGDVLSFDKVLLWGDGKELVVGKPYIAGKSIKGVLQKIGRAKKITVIKFKPKVRYRKKYGHRQPFMQIKIQ